MSTVTEPGGEFADGLRDLEGFSHIYLFYVFDRAEAPHLVVRPYLDREERGVFATRSPRRPNPLGLSLVRLVRREGAVLHVEDVDILDGTPLLDIKPFFSRVDSRRDARSGWLEKVDEATARALGSRRPSGGKPPETE
jgi:tRNA-Thr(GGU) m(6)t(6)A37 methyltransferase TsaA